MIKNQAQESGRAELETQVSHLRAVQSSASVLTRLRLGFRICTKWLLTSGLLWVVNEHLGIERSVQCLVHGWHSKNVSYATCLYLVPPVIQTIVPSFLLRAQLGDDSCSFFHPSKAAGLTSWYSVSLCSDPSVRLPPVPTSPCSPQPFLCLFVLSCLLRVDVISLMQAPRHQALRLCDLLCVYTTRMLNSVWWRWCTANDSWVKNAFPLAWISQGRVLTILLTANRCLTHNKC